MKRLVAVLAIGGCAPSQLPPTDVVSYSVGHRSGIVWFVVRSDLTAEYAREGSEDGNMHVRTKARQQELDALVAVFRKQRCCSLRSRRKHGVPDEARPSMAVHLDGVDCRIRLWDNEFSDRPRARACLAAVESLGSTLAARGAPDAAP